MSLTDKIIKNTYYHLISQAVAFLSPLVLTPIIISKIGNEDFGIYVLVLGFIGSFGLLDMGISSSFIKFISEHYNKGEKESLREVINTGFLFYFFFSLVIGITAYIFSEKIISLINIPQQKMNLAFTAFNIALIIFFLSTAFSIFNSVIIALQKMYIGAIASSIVTGVQIIVVLILMLSGFGLISLLIVNLSVCVVSIIITLIIAKKILPEIQITPDFFSRNRFRKMGVFGIQMQISRLASFAAEKYDEFLLGIFTNLTNVTFYNVGNKISSYGRIISLQVAAPIAPASAELSAKGETDKLKQLYIDCTKYLNVISIPIFVYMLVFADKIILAWLGGGYEISAVILRILAAGYLINFIMSAPGNAIIPNTGKPKYQMFEGLIGLSINLLLSYILVKQYGILGAAIGNLVSTIGASAYLFYKSNNFFGTNIFRLVKDTIFNPVLTSLLCTLLCYGLYILLAQFFAENARASVIFLVILNISVFGVLYIFLLFKSKFFNERDITFFNKFFTKVPLINMVLSKKRGNQKIIDEEIF